MSADDPKTTPGAEPEEAEGGTLAMDPELEEALREAAESVEAREAARDGHQDDAAPPGAPPDLPAAQARIAELEAELEATNDRTVRLQADFDNHRRRTLRERQEALQYGHENLVKDLLGTVDNLERAIEHASQSGGGDLDGLLQGIELVQRELLSTLNNHNVSVVDTSKGVFDPNVHEAMAQVEDPEKPAGHIVQVLQKGYQLRDRLLRPARVMVAKAPAEAKPDSADDDTAD